jgi:long-subunit acyl-CoA synthetase (AMP-forming)
VENGLLTPTMKVKRRLVIERYGREIAALGR